MRKALYTVIALTAAAILSGGPAMAADVLALDNCYSARGCTGRVLSHRDAHNCKVKSHGKSWRSGRTGTCYNL
ncbi:hypothetical protein ACWD4B_15830 [Streptomyces sp. NPDC002536]